MFEAERVEEDHLVDPVDEFGPEVLPKHVSYLALQSF
jgi:hypothetical protein